MQISADKTTFSPSDLTAYLACPHLTTLSLEVALGERKRPHTREALADLIAQKGELHEARYLEYLREQGHEVVEIAWPEEADGFEAAHEATVAAMREGREISRLQRASGLSLRYVSLIRRGEKTPHPRHWQALKDAVDH